MIRRMFLLVALIVPFAGIDTGSPALPGAGRLAIDVAAQETPLDLAWLVPSPADLNDEGYGLTYGVYQTAASNGVSIYGNPGPLTDYDEAFSAGSPRQTYYQLLSLRSYDDPDVTARRISVVLAEFEDDDAGETGFAAVSDVFATYDQTRTPPDVGDEALAFRGVFTNNEGREYQELRILVRTGRFLVDLTIDDYEGDAPATSELTPLAELLVERIETATASESPGYGLQVARISGEDVTTFYDYYTRRDDDEVPIDGERSSQRQSDDQLFEEAGMTDSYYYLGEVLPTDQDPTLLSATIDFRRFTDDERAAAYLATAVDDWTEAMGTAYEDIEVVDDAEELGDGSVAVSFVQDSSYGPLAGYRIWVQLDDRVAAVELNGDPAVELSVAEEMAEAQLTCLEDEECAEPLAAVDLMQAGPGASDEETPEAESEDTSEVDSPVSEPTREATVEASQDASVEPTEKPGEEATAATETYVSPNFGYSLSYDPTQWTVSEEPSTEGGIDNIGLQSGFTTVYLSGTTGVPDAQVCVQILTDTQTAEANVVGFEPMLDDSGLPLSGGDTSDYFATTRITRSTDDGGTVDQAFYARCIVLPASGAMLAIQQFSADIIYDTASEQREELLQGLTLP